MPAYYNENDPFAAAWLRELIKEGAIANGIVDGFPNRLATLRGAGNAIVLQVAAEFIIAALSRRGRNQPANEGEL